MVEVPPPTMVTMFPSMVATDNLELVYVNALSLLVVGGSNAKGAFPTAFDGAEKLDRTVVIRFTVKVAVIVPAK